jgi:hypothetical protein
MTGQNVSDPRFGIWISVLALCGCDEGSKINRELGGRWFGDAHGLLTCVMEKGNEEKHHRLIRLEAELKVSRYDWRNHREK